MAKILIIETSGASCSVAMTEDGKVLRTINDEKGTGVATSGSEHSTQLAPFIEIVMAGESVDAVAVSCGPGSYTGLRIGLSTAKGLCYGAGVPLILVDSLRGLVEELVKEVEEDAEICAMVDARRMEVFYARYSSKGEQLSEIKPLIIDGETTLSSAEKLYIVGSGAEKCLEVLSKTHKCVELREIVTSATSLAEYVYKKYCSEDFADLAYAEPLYVKEWQPYAQKK